ncbi:hypothetical protein VHUM_01216 [Vanrija humicola]|uniref:Major facilitator superfamily (MFS) profile domain-containing protein n=1 Tax=Vanrija humicola TaxID=5417 RepID=A0A7D8ZBD6_VANHU|nr:hypothetical protein VHUM_01216 [Vanrija humicola]
MAASTAPTAGASSPRDKTVTPPPLPDGCTRGQLDDGTPVIWVDFPAGSTENPFYFTTARKTAITLVASWYTFMTAYTISVFPISAPSMCADLGCSQLEVSAGVALYTWGFALAPLFLAPLSEELGRRWTYIAAVGIFWLFHIQMALAQNTVTILVSCFIRGCAGSVGATLVGGTISDIFIPARRGLPMAVFGFCAVFGGGAGAFCMGFVEGNKNMRWRWVWWLMVIMLGIFFPIVIAVMRETRAPIILARKAKRLRKERGDADGGRYMARGEESKVSFATQMKASLSRPLLFLITEPVVLFFSIWIGLGWGVFYTQIVGLPYIYKHIHVFSTPGQVGLTYLSIMIGAVIGFGLNFFQERLYKAKAAKRGVEARLYAPMAAGIFFAIGCYITGFTAVSNVHWIGPCIGMVVVLASVLTIYIASFTYLSECYGKFASSAVAGQSCLRNMISGGLALASTTMFDRMTVRWAIVMMAGIGTVLAAVPFVAFFYGPAIRAHSKYSRELMELERQELEKERAKREARGMDTADVEDLEGDANSLYEREHPQVGDTKV